MAAVIFYPFHPSEEKTHLIETTPMPVLDQDRPFPVTGLWDEFTADADRFFAKYTDKRFLVTGIAKKVGPDAHSKPSIELAGTPDGPTRALVIFPTDDHYSKVAPGDKVTVLANYLVMCDRLGLVMKHSQLVSVEK